MVPVMGDVPVLVATKLKFPLPDPTSPMFGFVLFQLYDVVPPVFVEVKGTVTCCELHTILFAILVI